jgi:hypothetical protein
LSVLVENNFAGNPQQVLIGDCNNGKNYCAR